MLNIHLPYNPAVPILGSIYPREMNTYALRKSHSQLGVRDGGKGNMRDACGEELWLDSINVNPLYCILVLQEVVIGGNWGGNVMRSLCVISYNCM